MHIRTKRLLLLLGTLVIVDLGLRVLVLLGLLPFQRYPVTIGYPVFLDDIHPLVGVWHHPDSTQHHQTGDFDVTYHSNSHGARDRERTRESDAQRRVVVLGDSFVEGFGVAREERFTDLLEESTGIEHLNFGASGSFGSIQEWLLYKDLASSFDHTEVFVFTLPFNDYMDNDPDAFPATRYRPYLEKNEGNFEVTYPVAFEERQRVSRDWSQIIKNTIDNHWYLANLLRSVTHRLKRSITKAEARGVGDERRNSYDSFTEIDLERLLFTYEQIVAEAEGRKVTIFTIPLANDFGRARREGYDFRLVDRLSQFADRIPQLRYVDLLPWFMEYAERDGRSYEEYTHRDDGHWNARGHAVMTEIIRDVVYSGAAD